MVTSRLLVLTGGAACRSVRELVPRAAPVGPVLAINGPSRSRHTTSPHRRQRLRRALVTSPVPVSSSMKARHGADSRIQWHYAAPTYIPEQPPRQIGERSNTPTINSGPAPIPRR